MIVTMQVDKDTRQKWELFNKLVDDRLNLEELKTQKFQLYEMD